MNPSELKFLLKLLGCPNYRSFLSAASFKSFKGKDKIRQDLKSRELIDFSLETATVKILPAGRALLKIDSSQLPISSVELNVLEQISKNTGKTKPSEIKQVKAGEREAIFSSLKERGLIEIETKIKKTKAEVWLTVRGIEYLQNDYNPKGTATISLDLLNNYLRFLRKPLNSVPIVELKTQPNDEQILQSIQDLDRELGTENYLPIFHLRQKLQPLLSREQLDSALYRLEKANQIELSSLAEPRDYTPEEIDMGISQLSGGSLFFITVN
jgi:hypothetical protein